MRASRSTARAAAGLLLAGNAVALDVDASSTQSLTDAASKIASSIMGMYDGKIPGLFPDPYYFWESGLAWDSMLYYRALTGDDQYDDTISQALAFQVGPDLNYMPPNQTKNLGNDDQSFWAMAAMTAAEIDFPFPSEIEGADSWQTLSQNVFDSQVARWDNDSCGGGLRWQIYSFNNGYDYKNSLTNGNFMKLAARLYQSTQNETYAQWFNTTAEWMLQVGLLSNDTGAVFDGTSVQGDCSQLNHIQWTANAAVVAEAYNIMNLYAGVSPLMITKILSKAQSIFTTDDDVITEIACAPNDNCNVDQIAFRAIYARTLASFQGLYSGGPDPAIAVDNVLTASAKAAGDACTEDSDGLTCASSWTAAGGSTSRGGLSADLSALNIMLANVPQRLGIDNAAGSGSSSSGGGASNGTATTTSTVSGGGGNYSATSAAGVPEQTGNRGEQKAASMFGLLGAVGFAVAFFL